MQNGYQWTRLAELVRLPQVLARDLDSEIKISKKSSQTLVFCPILGWGEFLLQPQIMYVFVNFRNQRSQHIAVQKAPGQVAAGAPRRVSMEALSAQDLDPEIKLLKITSQTLVVCPNSAFRNSSSCDDSNKSVAELVHSTVGAL